MAHRTTRFLIPGKQRQALWRQPVARRSQAPGEGRFAATLYTNTVTRRVPAGYRHGPRVTGMRTCPILPPPSRANRPTRSSSSTWRPISRSQGKTAGMGSACRPTWSAPFSINQAATTSNAASLPLASPGPDVRTAGTISWSPSHAKGAGCARRATPGVWRRRRRTWSITSSRRYRCASGSSRCPNGCAGLVEIRRSASRGRSAPCGTSCFASSRLICAGAAMPAHRPASKR